MYGWLGQPHVLLRFFLPLQAECSTSTSTVALSVSMQRNKDLLIMFEHGINVYDHLKCDATKLLTGSAACPTGVSSRTMLRLNRRVMITKTRGRVHHSFLFSVEAFFVPRHCDRPYTIKINIIPIAQYDSIVLFARSSGKRRVKFQRLP